MAMMDPWEHIKPQQSLCERDPQRRSLWMQTLFNAPGIKFLAGRLSKILILPSFIYLLSRFLKDGIQLSPTIIAPILLTLLTYANWPSIKDAWDARAFGATMFPLVPAKLPGSIDLLLSMNKAAKIGYPG